MNQTWPTEEYGLKMSAGPKLVDVTIKTYMG